MLLKCQGFISINTEHLTSARVFNVSDDESEVTVILTFLQIGDRPAYLELHYGTLKEAKDDIVRIDNRIER